MTSADIALLIHRRLYELAKILPEKEFVSRAEELIYILEKTRPVL